MQHLEYLDKNKKLQNHFLCFIDEENSVAGYFEDLIHYIENNKYQEDPKEFKTILYLISNISKYHHRSSDFFAKIERILSHYEQYIKQSYSSSELFKIFKRNPQILHFLFDKKIILIDEPIIQFILDAPEQSFIFRKYEGENSNNESEFSTKKRIIENYKYYFFNDIKSKLTKEEQAQIEKLILKMCDNNCYDFENKCKDGENDTYISKLIREDLIEEFDEHITKANLSLNIKITESIFETHPLLVEKQATLIEYAAFFGSIQIFNYLRMNNVKLTPSLWIYAIHGRNSEIIHILEDNHVKPEDTTFTECLVESIKCHHNEIAEYIENFLMQQQTIDQNKNCFKRNPFLFGLHYYNFEYLQDIENPSFTLFYACLYDHFPVVAFLINNKVVDLNQTIIYTSTFIKLHSTFQNQLF